MDAISMDDESDPPALVVRGDPKLLRQVQAILAPEKTLTASKTVKCAICWDECAELIRVLGCCHTSCQDCFTEYCTIKRDSKFPLRCFKEGCDVHLEIHQLRSIFVRPDFDQLLMDAVTDHFTRHPQEFAECSNADCSAYYSPKESRHQHTCPKCSTHDCPSCRVEFHFGETCEEYQDKSSANDRLLAEWVEKQGAKHCKNCNVIVEKLEGCDNMQCHLCQAHFCWQCMEIYSTHAKVYAHLLEKHGSFFGNPEEARRQFADGINDDDLEEDALVRQMAAAMEIDRVIEGLPRPELDQMVGFDPNPERVLAMTAAV